MPPGHRIGVLYPQGPALGGSSKRFEGSKRETPPLVRRSPAASKRRPAPRWAHGRLPEPRRTGSHPGRSPGAARPLPAAFGPISVVQGEQVSVGGSIVRSRSLSPLKAIMSAPTDATVGSGR